MTVRILITMRWKKIQGMCTVQTEDCLNNCTVYSSSDKVDL